MNADETKNIGLRGVTIADTHISMVDGANGKLFYRGYPIQQLAEHATFEEIIHLLMHEDAPRRDQLDEIHAELHEYRQIPGEVIRILQNFLPTAAPMDVMQAMAVTLAQFDPDLQAADRETVARSCLRLIARFGCTAAAWQRIRSGKEPVLEFAADHSQASAFLHGMWGRMPTEEETRLMDLLLVLHADHTFNASTFAVREVASTRANLYASISAGVGALSGSLHGGANAKVMQMLLEIGDRAKVAGWIADTIGSGERIMGLGHPVYKTEDPRAAILRRVADEALQDQKDRKWFELCLDVEKYSRATLTERKGLDLYPNVDFYSSPVLYGLGFPIDMFPVFFAVSRVAGWCAHYLEEHFSEAQPKPALYRPKANYTGRMCGEEGCTWPQLDMC
jgi:citrate synthase